MSARKKIQACLRFEGSVWRPNICRRCFADKSEHIRSPSDKESSRPSQKPAAQQVAAARRNNMLAVSHSVDIVKRAGNGHSHSASEAQPGKWNRSPASSLGTSGSRHVGLAMKKASTSLGNHFSSAEVIIVGDPGAMVQTVPSPTSASKADWRDSGTGGKSPAQSPLESPSSLDRGPASSIGSDDSGHNGHVSCRSSDSNQGTLVKTTNGKPVEGAGQGVPSNNTNSTPTGGSKRHALPLKSRHTDGEIVLHKRSSSLDSEGVVARSRSHSACGGAALTIPDKPVVASMSSEAINSARSPPPSAEPGESSEPTLRRDRVLSASIDNLLVQLQAMQMPKVSAPSGRSANRYGHGHRYSPHHQYRVTRDGRRQSQHGTSGSGEQQNGFSRSDKTWAERQQTQNSRSSTDGPSHLLKRQQDLSMSEARISPPAPNDMSGSDSCASPNLDTATPAVQADSRSNSRLSSPRTHDTTAMKFVVTQLEHISAAWRDADAQMDDLRAMSLADYRLVEDMAADWCDGTAATPLWQANGGGATDAADRMGEATLPVVCIRPGLKQPGRIYGMRVRVYGTDNDLDVSSYARFKTDYRVLERLRPHTNVLRVLAHFRDVVPSPGCKPPGGAPQAIFVIGNHLPLLNCRQYIPKCKEMLSKEGYERCVALLLYQLFAGLYHLHREGAIHCNLTLDNLLVVPTSHPGGGDRLVISSFGDSIYYTTPPEQFTVLTEQAAGMLDSGKGWKSRCQPPELLAAQREVAEGRTRKLVDLRHCDVYRAGQLLYQMLGLEAEVNDYVAMLDGRVQSAGLKAACEDTVIQLPPVPVTSCFSEPLGNLAARMMSRDGTNRIEPKEVLDAIGCILWGPTTGRGSLGLDPGVSADGWLRKRRLEVLGGFAGAYACPAAVTGQQQAAGGFALADELQCGFLVRATGARVEESLRRLRPAT